VARKPSTTLDEVGAPDLIEVHLPETSENGGAAVNGEADESTATPEEASAAQALAATEAKKEVPEADFSAFDAAVDAILAPHRAAEASGGETNGEPDEALIPELVTQYQALEGAKNKRTARDRIKAISEQCMNEDNFYTAKAAMLLDDKLVSAKTAKAPRAAKAPTDPTPAFLENLYALYLAFQYAGAAQVQPEGLAADWREQYSARIKDLEKELETFLESGSDVSTLPESSLIPKAIKLGTLRKPKSSGSSGPRVNGYSGPPRSIVKHINEAFANVASGTFLKIGDIAKFESQEYGSDHPSPGAISGQVKNTKFATNFPGLEAAEENGKKGIRKQ